MNKNCFQFKNNISKDLHPLIREYTKLLYKKGLSTHTISHYRCHITRIAAFNNIEVDKLTINYFD